MPKSTTSLGFGVVELDVDVCQPPVGIPKEMLQHIPGAIPRIFDEFFVEGGRRLLYHMTRVPLFGPSNRNNVMTDGNRTATCSNFHPFALVKWKTIPDPWFYMGIVHKA